MKHIKFEDFPDCIVCNTPGELLYEGLFDVRYGVEGSFAMKRCNACGLLWLAPRVAKEDIHKYYVSFFPHLAAIQDEGVKKVNFLASFKNRIKEVILCGYYGYRNIHKKHFLCFLGKFLGYWHYFRMKATGDLEDIFLANKEDRQQRMLIDVGCGEGVFLEMMKNLGWGVMGIEPHEEGVKILAQKGIPFLKGTLDDAGRLPDSIADQITLIHVLEHVYDPAFVISECFRLLKKGGRLVVHVPNAQSLAHKFFKKSCYHLDPPRHLFSFSLKSLKLIFVKSPFKAFSLDTASFNAKSIYDSSMQIYRLGSRSAAGVKHQKGRFLFYLLESLFILLGMPFGEEIRVVAVKR